MAILDGLPRDGAEMRQALGMADALVRRLVQQKRLTPGQKRLMDLLNEGVSMAAIAGITRAELDGLLAAGGRQLQAGDHEAAQGTLSGLLSLDPTNEKAAYLLGVSCQAQGAYELAGQFYIQFLAFDATNPQGYLRLGECFAANGEPEGARGCFEAAKLMGADDGKADPAVKAHADAMLFRLPAPPAA